MIASLKIKIWDNNLHHFLIIFCDDFLQHYVSFCSNGYQIERDVKEAGYCDNTKRREEVISIYSICRSIIFPAINELASLIRRKKLGEKFDSKKEMTTKVPLFPKQHLPCCTAKHRFCKKSQAPIHLQTHLHITLLLKFFCWITYTKMKELETSLKTITTEKHTT